MTAHEAYCSWCFERTEHEPLGRNWMTRDLLQCRACGGETVECVAVGCGHMARNEGRLPDHLCAAHQGRIAGFSNLHRRLERLEDYPTLFEREVRDLRMYERIGMATLGGGLVLGPAAFMAAPAVGGAVGSLYGLSGAAAVSKGLATLGMGAVSAGGLGMAGGAAVIAAVGAATGGTLSGVVANAYFAEIEGFKITRLKEGEGPSVVLINGFLTQDETNLERQWLETLGRYYLENPWYLVEWENKRLRDFRLLGYDLGAQRAILMKLSEAAAQATRHAAGQLNPIGKVSLTFKLAKNPWHVAMVKAAQTGALLADILARTPEPERYVLMGHSLGGRVIHYALRSLAGRPSPRIESAHLLGAAVGRGCGEAWDEAASAVEGQIHNYYSRRDKVLRFIYTAGRALIGTPAAGCNPIRAAADNIVNHNVTPLVGSHGEWKRASTKFLMT